MKIPVSARLDPDVFERVKTLATVDRRSIAEIIAWAVQTGLPTLEAQQAAKAAALREEPAPYRVKMPVKTRASQ